MSSTRAADHRNAGKKPWQISRGVNLIGDSFDSVLDAARAGGEWAWTQLYRDLSPVVLGYLRGQGAAEPEDLLGDVFVHIVRGLADFEGDEAGFRSWVFVIAHHRLQDERRRRIRRPEEPAPILDTTAPVDVAGEAMANISVDSVRQVLETLVPAQRDVLLLRILAGLTIDEIAQILGKRVGAVKALQRRGLQAVKRELDEGVPL